MGQMKMADLIASTTIAIVDKEEDYYVPDKHDNSQMIHVDDWVLFATLFGRKEVFSYLPFQDIYAADSHLFFRGCHAFPGKKSKPSKLYLLPQYTQQHLRNFKTKKQLCACLSSQRCNHWQPASQSSWLAI